MWRGLVLAGLLVAGEAAAHPGPSLTVSIDFRQGNDQDVVAGLTFGMVISHDGGATWRWMCEKALQYGFPILPRYAYARSGALYCASHGGLIVNRDGCTFDATTPGTIFMPAVAIGPDDAVYAAAAQIATPAMNDPGESRIFKSTDDGVTFAPVAMPGQVGDYWNSIAVAPADAQRVYLTGYRIGMPRTFLVLRSDDGGATFQPMSMAGITTTSDSEIWIGGISATDPDTVYVRVSNQRIGVSDAIFRSTTAGQGWTRIYDVSDELSFLVRASGDLVVAGRNSGVHRSTTRGDSWTALTGAPEINCLAENAAGEVWACTQDLGIEGAAIMKTSDLASWTRVLRYRDIGGPVDCAPGTIQRDACIDDPGEWCVIRAMFGIEVNPTACESTVPDLGAADGTIVEVPCDGCCCRAGSGPGSGGLLVGAAVWVGGRRRRRFQPVR